MMHRFFFLILLLSCFQANAQFNDSTNYFVRYVSAGIVNRTNDRNSYVLNNQFRFSLYKKNISVNTNNSWIYGEQQRSVSNNDFSSTLDFDLFKGRRHIYYWGLLNYEKSLSLKIHNRFQGGIGIGYYVIDQENFVIQISDGILYETSELYTQDGLSDADYETYRNSFRLKYRFVFRDAITLDGVNFLQHSLSDKKDYIVRINTNLSIKLYKWISLTAAVSYNKLNKTARENFLLNYGVSLEKYF